VTYRTVATVGSHGCSAQVTHRLNLALRAGNKTPARGHVTADTVREAGTDPNKKERDRLPRHSPFLRSAESERPDGAWSASRSHRLHMVPKFVCELGNTEKNI
jgi:hypothetical protein